MNKNFFVMTAMNMLADLNKAIRANLHGYVISVVSDGNGFWLHATTDVVGARDEKEINIGDSRMDACQLLCTIATLLNIEAGEQSDVEIPRDVLEDYTDYVVNGKPIDND